jgi:hypothetical protein
MKYTRKQRRIITSQLLFCDEWDASNFRIEFDDAVLVKSKRYPYRIFAGYASKILRRATN